MQMDIYPVVCFKVDENGRMIEVLNSSVLPFSGKDEDLVEFDEAKQRDTLNHPIYQHIPKLLKIGTTSKNVEKVKLDSSKNQRCQPAKFRVKKSLINKIAVKVRASDRQLVTTEPLLKPKPSSVTELGELKELGELRHLLTSIDRNTIIERVLKIGCLFRCISYGMYGVQIHHEQVRQNIVTNIINNWDHHRDYLKRNALFYKGKVDCKKSYLDYMSQNDIRGGHLELRVATAIFNIYVDLINGRDRTVQRYGTCLHMKKNILLYFDPIRWTYDFIQTQDARY